MNVAPLSFLNSFFQGTLSSLNRNFFRNMHFYSQKFLSCLKRKFKFFYLWKNINPIITIVANLIELFRPQFPLKLGQRNLLILEAVLTALVPVPNGPWPPSNLKNLGLNYRWLLPSPLPPVWGTHYFLSRVYGNQM